MKSRLSIVFILIPSKPQLPYSRSSIHYHVHNRLHFLIGEWIQEINGEFEMGEGLSYGYNLNKKIITRKNLRAYFQAKGEENSDCKNALIVYLSNNEEESRADYYDSEGNVITYSINFTENKIFFSSNNEILAPRFRMRYTLLSDNSINIKFDIALAHEENYTTYLEGSTSRLSEKN